MKKSKGFTLMEMLVVVAIMGILVAVAIPSFTGSLNKARETTCAANKRSMQAELITNELTTGVKSTTVPDGYTCPTGGTYAITWTDGQPVVTCSDHK